MADERREITLITGASEGIGRELARVFAAHGHDLALVARSRHRLEELAEELRRRGGPRVHVLPHDLLDPQAPFEIAKELNERRFDVGILVNNAGVMDVGRFHKLTENAILGEVHLNAVVPTALCHRFLPGMVERDRGRILNVASTAAFQAMPSLSTYAATKAYLLTLSEGLAEELADTGVSVTVLAPGPVKTNLLAGARQASAAVARLLPENLANDPATIAQEGFEACMAGEVLRIPGLGNRVTATIVDIVPRSIIRRFAGIVGRRLV
ncbi:MAG: SDR family oxidoreductase [bacterium]